MLLIGSPPGHAADVWVGTDIGGDGSKNEWYVQTHRIQDNEDLTGFNVPLKLVVNGRLGNNRMHTFRMIDGTWYCKQTNSSREFIPVNGYGLYEKMFDAVRPYSESAKRHPR